MIKDFVETRLCKPRVTLPSRVLRGLNVSRRLAVRGSEAEYFREKMLLEVGVLAVFRVYIWNADTASTLSNSRFDTADICFVLWISPAL